MAITSKERLLTALNLGKPDRIPVTIHQWQNYHLKYFMDGKSDIEAFREVGLDAAITRFPIEIPETCSWRVSSRRTEFEDHRETDFTVETPEGMLTYKVGENEITSWTLQHMIKRDEDIYLIKKYMPVPVLYRKLLESTYDEIGDSGILRTFVFGNQGGCWQDACVLCGTQEMIFAAFDKPGWVHELLGILLDKKLAFIEKNLKGAKADLIETGGGAASNNVISPSIHEEFCLPYDRKMHNALKSIGHKVVYHTCGGMTKILDLIIENGCDASETLSPIGVGGDIADPSVIVDKFGGRLAMIGGVDQFEFLTNGTPEKIRAEVKRLFEGFGKNGGYIMSASDHFFHAPKSNLIEYALAAKECVY